MLKQAASSSSSNAVELFSLVLESSHDSKMVNVLQTASSESRMMSLIAESFIFNNAPSWSCSVEVKLCCANFTRNVLSSSSRKIKTYTYWVRSIGWSITHNERVKHYLTTAGNNTLDTSTQKWCLFNDAMHFLKLVKYYLDNCHIYQLPIYLVRGFC